MKGDAQNVWNQLFPPAADDDQSVTLRFRLLCRRGEPLLLIPCNEKVTKTSLELYPAQSRQARLARGLAAFLMRGRLTKFAAPASFRLNLSSPFARFIDPDATPSQPPLFAMLFGNPNVAGRRFVLLAFDRGGLPAKVIKAGAESPARQLIQREADFLQQHGDAIACAPRLLDRYEDRGVNALALQHVPGTTARATDLKPAAEVLTRWLRPGRLVQLDDLPAWQRLRLTLQPAGLLSQVEQSLAGAKFHPAIHHGDFAPWNVRVNPDTRKWTVLDWERGEMTGPPGWDWFHFALQPALLVRKASAHKLAQVSEELVRNPLFGSYAEAAGIADNVRSMLLGYLLHCCQVLKPSEGLETTQVLLGLLSRKWLITDKSAAG